MWWVSARFRMIALIGCVFFCACQKSFEAGPTVFLASSFASVADDIKARLPKAATIILMNSSAIARQIEQGAPCDGAILADNSWNFWLSERNIAEPAGVVAVNSLVLASATPMSSIKDLSFYLQHLKSQEKIIIADPDYVPLGRYTKEALSNLGLDQQLEAHFIRRIAQGMRALCLSIKRLPLLSFTAAMLCSISFKSWQASPLICIAQWNIHC